MNSLGGLILAAGCSTRMGQSKPLLDWYGQTLIEYQIKIFNYLSIEPIVILGFQSEMIQKKIKNLNAKIVVNQNYKMRFDTNINSTLDWNFTPEIKTLNLKPGEVHTVKFYVENPNDQISSGSASFNVSPAPFGIYLNKIGCFCFEKQTLDPGQKRNFVLTFFLDPKVVDDNKTNNISDVTLSFTFFSSEYYKKDSA